MKLTSCLAIGVVCGALSLSGIDAADAKVRVVPYTKAGNWSVRAVYSAKGPFDHCSANTKYVSGTRVSIIAYRSGNWRLWFAHDSWPDRGRQRFPARVVVDGRTVLNDTGHFKGRNAYVDLGRNVERVRAIMRGRSMSVVTPSGTSSFSLRGTSKATRAVARCWKAHYRKPAGGGAFGSANGRAATGGAFGGQPAQPKRKANELSRGDTLALATRYLARSRQPYSILPREKGPLKHFPVNWKMQNGTIGGMRVFKNTTTDVTKLLSSLLAEQAKYCEGRSATEKGDVKTVKGRRMVRARGVCETNKGRVLNITYKVAELGRKMVMMITEFRSGGAVSKQKSGQAARSGSDNLPKDQIRIPAPNEL